MNRWSRFAMVTVVAGWVFGGCNCSAPAPMGDPDLLFTGEGGISADLAGPDLSSQASPDLAGADLTGVPPADLAGDDLAGADLAGQPPADLAGADLTGVNLCPQPTMSCYNGRMGTQNVGVCKAGTSFCMNGNFGPCTGEIDPAPLELCNGLDDDCNNMVDDNLGTVSCGVGACKNTVPACANGKPGVCMPKAAGQEMCGNNIDDNCDGLVDEGCGCVYVSALGSDMNGNGTAGMPFRTIQKGISSAGMNGLPNTVCVASGNVCPSNFVFAEQIAMRDGVSVYGSYQQNGNVWPRNNQCVTVIADQQHNGVTFDNTVQKQTILDGFTINGHVDPTSAAVSVFGSKGAVISNNTITGFGTQISYGVNVADLNGAGAAPTIARNGIQGGNGTALSIGVHSINSSPTIQANCDTIDQNTGRCTSGCGNNSLRYIRGRTIGGNGTETYGVRLESSPGAIIDQDAVCGNGGTGEVAGIRLTGNGAGTLIRASNVSSGGLAQNSVAFWADPCMGASPWVLNNQSLLGSSALMGGRADGVRAIGDCHPRIDSNVWIVGGIESANNDANGVFCVKDPNSGISSRCTVIGNLLIQGSGAGFPPRSIGVHCDDGACARIERNLRITALSGIQAYGVVLGATNTVVAQNTIDAGCARGSGVGLASVNSYARVENNIITGTTASNNCTPGATVPSIAVWAALGPGNTELDLHSNDLFGAGSVGGGCISAGLVFDIPMGGQPQQPRGIVRNNIIYAGECVTRFSVAEGNAGADPRIFENNDLWVLSGMPTALYRDENMNNLTMLAQVNGLLSGPVAANNISANPGFVNGLHIPANSPCTDTGTASGAPVLDIENDARPQNMKFDIGADEYKP